MHANWEQGTDIYLDGYWEEQGPNPGQYCLHLHTKLPIWKFSWYKILRGWQRPKFKNLGWVFFPGHMVWVEPNPAPEEVEEPNRRAPNRRRGRRGRGRGRRGQ